jgi:organic hydroperoxide reductase OsmC/OhrA
MELYTFMSRYTAHISWKSDSPETFTKQRYTRGHVWEFDGGVSVPASSSPQVVPRFSVEAAVDPEEALVASAASCHMLTFLYLAAKGGFNVASYTDNAVGVMEKREDGRQWLATITLDPQIVWIDGEPTVDELAALHHNAHKECYIANSIRSEIIIKGIHGGNDE